MTSRGWLILGFVALFVVVTQAEVSSLPLYGARSGRICDNCHSSPTGWHDPPSIKDRKCSLSCVTCHVDPNGGGLRTVSGRYYGESTLPSFLPVDRPWSDVDRGLFGREDRESAPWYVAPPPGMAAQQEDPRGPGAPPVERGLVLGRSLNHGANKMAWLDGRYGDLVADPLLAVGADARWGLWNQGPLIFPMQADVHVAVHPVEHLTAAATVGARGRTRSLYFDGGPLDDAQPRIGVRDLWVMTHEWPYLSYMRVGRFLPAFGTRVADHTAYTRRPFGLSQENPANRVLGVEVGLAANYPYATASVFKPSTMDAQNPVEPGEGWGGALSGGYRALGWQLGASAMMRRRPLNTGGDTTDLSIQWAVNPWFYSARVPLTYLGEAAFGTLQRPYSGRETTQVAAYHQLAWSVINGVIVRGRFDFWDPDREVIDDDIYRPGIGLDWTVIPGLTTSVDGRVGMPAAGQSSADVFLQLHGWF